MGATLLALAPDLLAVVACAAAVRTDHQRRRIPNWLTAAAAAAGLAFAALAGLPALGAALGGATLGLVVFGVPAAFGLVGMGDVKLVAALGALVRWPLALPFVLYTAIAGGVVALVYAYRAGRVVTIARNMIQLRRDVPLHRMPYALAIMVGCIWAVASRYASSLRLLDL